MLPYEELERFDVESTPVEVKAVVGLGMEPSLPNIFLA